MLMQALEKVTGVSAKDCIVEGQLVSYLVPDGMVGKAIGAKAVNVKMLEQRLGKKVEIVSYTEKPEEVFAKAMEVNLNNVKTNGNKLIINLDGAAKENVYKKNSRLRRVKELISRNFNLELVIN